MRAPFCTLIWPMTPMHSGAAGSTLGNARRRGSRLDAERRVMRARVEAGIGAQEQRARRLRETAHLVGGAEAAAPDARHGPIFVGGDSAT